MNVQPSDTGAGNAPSLPDTLTHDSLLDSVAWLCAHYGLGRSHAVLISGLAKYGLLTPSLALEALTQAGLAAKLVERPLMQLPEHLLPAVLLRRNGSACVLLGRRIDDSAERDPQIRYRVMLPELGEAPVECTDAELGDTYSGYALLVKPAAKVDARPDDLPTEPAGHWLLRTLWRYRSYYASAAVGAFLINVLGLASVFFTMNVYDRVVPNQAYVTLWSLAIGVALAMLMEAVSRHVRAHVLDTAGKKADLVLGSLLFRQALAIRMEHRPASAGSFAHRLREFESVRDFATSATLSVVSDLPFVFLFVGVVFAVGGPLGWIPLLMIPLIVGLGAIVQWPLARAMRENLREASLKQGVLIESIDGLETLKAVGGEGAMRHRWDAFSAKTAASSMQSRQLSSMATSCVSFLQQMQTVAIVIVGVYLIGEGKLTQGALIGSVMLAGRVTAPLGQVMGLALRFQQAKTAMHSLNQLMAMPVEHEPGQDYLAQPPLSGHVKLDGVSFEYPSAGLQQNAPALDQVSVEIRPGERVAILGRVGSGKSTLLRLIARLYQPTAGKLLADGLDAAQIAPADWRRAFGYVGQDSRLFYGSLRENVTIGRPDVPATELLRVLKLTGLDALVAQHPAGVNLQVGENGRDLSGGQRQLVALARSLIARPRTLLLDEPTSAMDSQTEAQFIEHLRQASAGQTLVVVTHRTSLLALVDRIVIVDQGKIVMDGEKARVLAALSGQPETGEHHGPPEPQRNRAPKIRVVQRGVEHGASPAEPAGAVESSTAEAS
ncbi:ABC transporter [Burkholderia contaminans FFH2055]|uniref:Cyclolysin secretion/processing ATP-binding protein CyaB n=1 Tax=Burkholderia contaminans TaxID=488447 RepID=A0A3N8RIN6_9BURK|nr:type I secretion system permease/ATPase [Burkholderia contaminans]KKL36701.1 ABC transporter [Burkholderia contaminans FFH2055]MEB4633635.1 type I secretion system permease/ATPase [Burkholderia contaminans]MEB4638480.1 type I secretion system permease/ATPase [Burkholderia contaminans]MEB4655080.1 type I secretion system permease/ATPase [Burkholderia contaminans]MEB4663016.1 type I secretion system permease/ATPase [Burkholderia contaminans]